MSTLRDLLEETLAQCPEKGIQYLEKYDGTTNTVKQSYQELYAEATRVCAHLKASGVRVGAPVVFQVAALRDILAGFWACVLGGFVALPITLVPNFTEMNANLGRLRHALALLGNPHVLIRRDQEHNFTVNYMKTTQSEDPLKLVIYDDIPGDGDNNPTPALDNDPAPPANPRDTILYMLTSGSSGNSKVVMLSHGNVIAAVTGKSKMFELNRDSITMNWISMDHVAGIIEGHLMPLLLGATQINVQTSAILSNPSLFLRLIQDHKVNLTFAPNFMLRKLIEHVQADPPQHLDLSSLRRLLSGGEAVVVKTAQEFLNILAPFGLSPKCITPGFGMTETCAGCAYQLDFPTADKSEEFGSLGGCIDNVEVRVVDDDNRDCPEGVPGNLQVRGASVLGGYCKNPVANRDSFVGDWFITGDRAMIHPTRGLVLTGRTKDSIIINGNNLYSHEMEALLEEMDCIESSWTAVCPIRLNHADTEQILVLCHLKSREHLVDNLREIRSTLVTHFGVRPAIVLPLEKSDIPKSSLGKISRTQMREKFERGEFKAQFEECERLEKEALEHKHASTETEAFLQAVFANALLMGNQELSVNANFFDLGGSSVTMIGVKVAIDERYKGDFPVINLFQYPTVESLAAFLDVSSGQKMTEYNPIIPLQLQAPDDRSPLFMVHPGVGDILIFTELAKLFRNYRKFYAIRARGFNDNEDYFSTFQEMVSVYVEHILKVQPQGPYYLSGYSYGGAVASEIAKSLEQLGHRVAFVGLLNIPPHIAERMHEINDFDGLMNLVLFVDLLSPAEFKIVKEDVRHLPKQEQLEEIVRRSDQQRVKELNIDAQKLDDWVALARSLIECGKTHDPDATGKLKVSPKIFWAKPLFDSVEEWLEKLRVWQQYTEGQIELIEVPGEHYTLMSPRLVRGFAAVFKRYMGNDQ
jgi:acyl-CoA synthetase (AMP-forming)/AMP-acid ligase II/thioesterase domain-containing protein/acyl carrier protein